MRFDSPEHLAAWRATGRFPAIHDGITQAIVADMRGSRVLDMGCSYGLLAERILKQAGAMVAFGVDADANVIEAGRGAGLAVTLVELEVSAASLPQIYDLVRENALDVLVCRRVLPELFGDDLPLGRKFALEMALAGIREIFVEGRVATVKAVNALSSIDEEVKLLSASFREVRRSGAVSYLRPMDA